MKRRDPQMCMFGLLGCRVKPHCRRGSQRKHMQKENKKVNTQRKAQAILAQTVFVFKLMFAHAGEEVFSLSGMAFGDAKFETMAADWKSSRVVDPRGYPATGVVARVARPSPTISTVAASADSSSQGVLLQSQRSPSRMWFRVRRLRD